MPVVSRRVLAGLAAQVVALTLAACGGDDGGSTPPPANSPDILAPSVPAGVTATATSPTQVQLSWTASTDVGAGVAGYRVYRDGAANPIANVTTTGYTDSNLNPQTSYSYNVRAFDGATPANESALSGAVTATTPAAPVGDSTPPTVPANLTGTALSTTQIRLSWTASTDAGIGVAGYYVYRDGATTPTATVNGATTYTDGGLTANTSYSYTLRAFDAATPPNVSNATAAVSATTLAVADTTPPTVPASLTATVLSSSSIRLNWVASTDAGTGVAGYRVYQNGSSTPLAGTVSGVTTTLTGLAANTMYSFTVTAIDRASPANESGPSNNVSATTPGSTDTTAPTVPTNVAAAAQSSTSIQVTWTASTDNVAVAGYRIFRNGSTTILATVTSGTAYADTGLAPGTAYTYQVRAFDTAATPNVSALSTPAASATTLADTTAPGVPSGVTATSLSTSEIRVDWTATTDQGGAGLAGYRIFRNGSGSVLATVTSGTTYTDSGLSSSTAYSYQVRAFDLASPPNVSALSTPVATATTGGDTTAPTVPTNVAAATQSSTSIQVTWTASTDNVSLAGYRIYRNGSTTVLSTVTNGTTYNDTGLMPGTAYSYQVRAFDNSTPPNVSALSTPAASATTSADTTAPAVPPGVSATALSSSSIRIDWSASTDQGGAGLAGYRVFRNGSSTILATITSGTTYTDTGLTASTNYSYQLRAFDAATPPNVSGLSTAVNATTQAAQNPSSGLDARPSNTSCVAGAPPSSSASFVAQQVFASLSFSNPVAILQAPGDNSRWFVVQQGGIVKVFNNVASPAAPTNFIDLSGRVTFSGGGDERGLLSMAFHPNFPTDPRVYLYYTGTDGSLGAVEVLSEFRTTNGGTTLDASTENILFKVDDPESNHNGGTIGFGPDGYLYSSIGDGGGGNDQHGTIGNSQRLTILLGKMLRIDVGNTPGAAYTIPPGNPFAGGARCNASGTSSSANCPEIYAYGFRNPWRWSFDNVSGELWLGDVGESAWEEIDKVVLGGNYGWRCREGNHAGPGNCGPNPNPIAPVAEADHSLAAAITGGYVYRGSAIPGLIGRYVFGDFSSGYIWNIARDTAPTLQLTAGMEYQTPASIAGFGEDQARELYFVSLGGDIYKIVPGGGGGGGTVAGLLSQTGCANSSNPKLPSSGMIPYAPNAAFWSDGAVKSRWLALPNGQRMTVDSTSNHFDFPNGSVLRKDFTIGGTLAETRLFMHHTDGSWAGYTYQWNAQGTDATRVVGGLTTTVNGQTWDFPSEAQCLMCHTSAAGRTLGLETGQLNGDLTYPVTGRTANQVFTLNFIDTLTPPVTLPVDQLPLIPNPVGSTGTVGERARAWLHTNCANCHRPGGPTPVNLDFRFTTSLLGTNTCDVQPTVGDLGIANARLIAPGDAARSVVVSRVDRTDANMMPPLARHTIDTAGVQLLTSWINGLSSCN